MAFSEGDRMNNHMRNGLGAVNIKVWLQSIVYICVFSLLSLSWVYADTPVRIMPLGDSITDGFGSSKGSGYRYSLYHALADAGYAIEFVGGLMNGPYDYDRDHEGHSGYTAQQILDNIYLDGENWLGSNPADVIILHIGTNDISQGSQNVNTVAAILDKIDQYEADTGTTVVVGLAG